MTYNCFLCDLVFYTKKSLREHDELEHKETQTIKNETIDEEEQDVKLNTEVQSRMMKGKDAEGGIMWTCTECGKTQKQKFKLQMHIDTHLKGFVHRCPICDKIHKTRGSLKSHIIIKHKQLIVS